MSLDFHLYEATTPERRVVPCPHCGQPTEEAVEPAVLFSTNITHNLGPMWREAGVRDALYESNGKPAADVIPALAEGVAAMSRDPARFRKFNASNGWGTYDDALPWLRNVLAACKEHPTAIIRISR